MARTIYGVALNDRVERERLSAVFEEPPYVRAPQAPVLYVKPANCVAASGATITVPVGAERLDASPTYALIFPGVRGVIGGVALALDVSEPQRGYYRPAVRQQGRDGFLPLGPFQAWDGGRLPDIEVEREGQPDAIACWRAGRMVRSVDALLAEIGDFMSLSDGDILLIGAQPDPVAGRPGSQIRIKAAGYPVLHVSFAAETAS